MSDIEIVLSGTVVLFVVAYCWFEWNDARALLMEMDRHQ